MAGKRARRARERAEERASEAALRACLESWLGFSVALVAAFQRPECGPGRAVAYAARYSPLEPLIVALNAGSRVGAVRPLLRDVARVLDVEGDLTDAQILAAAARFFDALRDDLAREAVAGLPA